MSDAFLIGPHVRLHTELQMTTNVRKPGGQVIYTTWLHRNPDGTVIPCLVAGIGADEALEKAKYLDETL